MHKCWNIWTLHANKCHMLYDWVICNLLHRAIISAKELQFPDDSGLTSRLIDSIL